MKRSETDGMEAELVLDARAAVGEGPVWDRRDGVLWWVDAPRGAVHRFDPATRVDSVIELGRPVGAVAPRAAGGLVAAMGDGFAVLDTETGVLEMLAEIEPENPNTRMNDGNCDASGRFWAGTSTLDAHRARNAGSLYRLDPGGSVHKILSGVSISNGIDWSPDGQAMYYIDTLAFSVDVLQFDVVAGGVTNRRPLVTFGPQLDPLVGPDGMCVDSEGFLWVAVWGGWSVRRFTPDGEPAGEIRLPVALVTSCAFGGDDLGDLYITTAAQGSSTAKLRTQPHAGGLYRCRAGAHGRPVNVFAG